MKNLIFTVFLILISSTSFAEKVFDGWYGQVSIGAAKANSNETTDALQYVTPPNVYQNFNFSKVNIASSAALGYSKSFDKWNLSVNGFYNYSSNNFGTAVNAAGSIRQANIKNIFGVSVEPGYYFDEKVLGYAKIGLARSNQFVRSLSGADDEYFGSSNGFLYGVGFKYALDKHWHAGAEVYQISFPTQSFTTDDGNIRYTCTFKTKHNYAGLLLSYKF